MKTTEELEQGINQLTTKINKEYPELSKYISEMRISNSQSEDVNINSLHDYYNSLEELMNKYAKTHIESEPQHPHKIKEYADLQIYPPSEDIYEQLKQETEINPEDISKNKVTSEDFGTWDTKDFQNDKSGADLDVPGSELDDKQENLGSEDEENNYYSLGGDNHNDLEEDKG